MSILADDQTRIVVQGITGREATTFCRESVAYGAKIVAGVTPGKGDSDVHGIPVYDTVAQALREHPASAGIVSVPAAATLDAALEAIENGLSLLVILTERIPRRDVVEVLERASEHGCRVIGPNSLGVICPGQTRVGMNGGSAETVRRAYCPGPVGIMSRSGGMTTEIASMLTLAGLGQSTCVSVGGDPIVGSTFLDLLPLYEQDPDTRALVLFCEPGGAMEEALADHLQRHGTRLPIVAFVAGRFAEKLPGVRFGHAAAIVEEGRGSPTGKIAALRAAGVRVADHLSDIPRWVREAIA